MPEAPFGISLRFHVHPFCIRWLRGDHNMTTLFEGHRQSRLFAEV